MKNLSKIFIVLFSLLSGVVAFAATGGNAIATFAAPMAVSTGLQYATGISLFSEGLPSLMCVLTALKATSCGKINPGGGHRVWLIPVDQFTAPWGHKATNGVIVDVPQFMANFTGAVEFATSDDSLKLDQSATGSSGYIAWLNSVEFKTAGDYAEQTAAVEKLINTQIVMIIELNDLQRKNVGNTIFPLTLEISHTTGSKGTDQRGWTFKAKNNGLPVPSYFLGTEEAPLIFPIAPAA